MQKKGRVVILNGVGSAGKGSIAEALQSITAEPFLHVEMDGFLDMMPEHLWNHPDGIIFETIQEDGKPSVAIKTGHVVDRLLTGMRRAIAAMAGQGNNLIIDEVMTEADAQDYRRLLEGFDVTIVGVFAGLDILEARERDRGDRMIGLARWQNGRIHKGIAYDLEIDTSDAMPHECAEQIRIALNL